MTAPDELFELSKKLRSAADTADEAMSLLAAVEAAANEVGRSFSGSWLGYHSRVYYSGFTPPPPGAHFSQEWGLGGEEWLGLSSRGDWKEYDPEKVKSEIFRRAENPDLASARAAAKEAETAFLAARSEIQSILFTSMDGSDDKYLKNLDDELENLKPASKFDVLNHLSPKGQVMTRDTIAIGQGNQPPPHVEVLSEVISLRHSVGICRAASEIAAKAGSHLTRKARKQKASEMIGTNVFIGHGRSLMWRELKDFIQDRLRLPWDEFNRVPVAGVTNIARLSEMLDAAAIAFLIMTAEDEMADGEMQARMNVVHEAGLFQGRLGFTKAIVLLEEGCQEFSNIQGLGQIRFPRGKIASAFEEVRLVLEREGLITSS